MGIRPNREMALGLVIAMTCNAACVSRKPEKDAADKIGRFLTSAVVETLEKGYRSHGMDIHVLVTKLTIDHLSTTETEQDYVYSARGSVTYIIKGKRKWKDRQGNSIVLGPEQEVTHWYTCAVLEDKYMHALFTDDRHRLTFHADRPTEDSLE